MEITKLRDHIYCTISHNNTNGILQYNNDGIILELYGVTKPDRIDPIHLVTSDALNISLYDNIYGGPAITSRRNVTMNSCRIYSNIAIIGNDPWEVDDIIYELLFTVDKCSLILSNRNKIELLSKGYKNYDKNNKLFEIRSDLVTYMLNYKCSYSMGMLDEFQYKPQIQILFAEGVPLCDYYKHIKPVVQYLSLCSGTNITPEHIRISKHTVNENQKMAEKGNPNEYHFLHVLFDKAKQTEQHFGNSPSLCINDKEIESFKECLSHWITRSKQWESTYDSMQKYIKSSHIYDNSKIISAFTWLDSIPGSKQSSKLPHKDALVISKSALATAKEIGYNDDIKVRIEGAIGAITLESNADRFKRIYNAIKKRFNLEDTYDGLPKSLVKAYTFRGTAAHGQININSDKKWRDFLDSIYATETACFLLTLFDLPLTEEAFDRIKMNDYVAMYRRSKA